MSRAYRYNILITYWNVLSVNRYGQPVYSTPKEAKVRWEDRQRLFLTENGREVRGNSIVYAETGILQTGDYVFKGSSTALAPPTGSFEVKQPRQVQNLRGTKTEFRYIL